MADGLPRTTEPIHLLLTWIRHLFHHLWAVLEDGLLLRQALVAIRAALRLLLEVVVPIILLLHSMGITMVIPTVKETLMATRLKATKVITILLPSTISATTMVARKVARKVATGRIVIHMAAIPDRGETTILAVVTRGKYFVYSNHTMSWAVDRC